MSKRSSQTVRCLSCPLPSWPTLSSSFPPGSPPGNANFVQAHVTSLFLTLFRASSCFFAFFFFALQQEETKQIFNTYPCFGGPLHLRLFTTVLAPAAPPAPSLSPCLLCAWPLRRPSTRTKGLRNWEDQRIKGNSIYHHCFHFLLKPSSRLLLKVNVIETIKFNGSMSGPASPLTASSGMVC